ncbi:hypothetical protein ACS0ST_11055 [Klebsiella aerogenes]|uniref:hypothetical protein n=1 Tax=Klebsiella aerogenes TaxID=548 RepID=UPI00063C87B0|nr:hypothetical protein [Klebsiella aerogenes]EKU8182323.1 hypothetical protein [Klebsiella aerogenes]ELA1937659.1 hypothetical protein [Klebsiella aerogenes]ELA2017965.1 hypothetical protein [Klebsiella aerogenes]KLF05663.1 hypothetical protein YA25_12160 [Klebsiella aerogenes]HDT6520954.1 hypothetical protein [Klebsiella aerogenes]
MWSIPTWSLAVDGLVTAFSMAEGKDKKLSKTYSLSGKRSRSDKLLSRILGSLAGENPQLNLLINLYLDVIQTGLRELHTQQLYPVVSDKVCNLAFYEVWVVPFLLSMKQHIVNEGPESEQLCHLISLLLEYQAVSHKQTVDRFLNKRVLALLPHGCCVDFKMQIHKNRNRRVFSFNASAQQEQLAAIRRELKPGESTEESIGKLSMLFRSGGILRCVEKWLGGGKWTRRVDDEQQARTAEKITTYAESVIINSHHFLTNFSQEVGLFYQLTGHAEIEPEAQLADPDDMSPEEINRFWHALLLKKMENSFLDSSEAFFLEDVHQFCVEYAPPHLQQYLSTEEIETVIRERDWYLYTGAPREQVIIHHDQVQQMAFLALKKIVVDLHAERQLGLYGVALSSTLISLALSNTYRITTNELTPLLNILIENLPTNNNLFIDYPYQTPFNTFETASPGMPRKQGQGVEKDDEALIFALACRLHNLRIFRLYENIDRLHFLASPFGRINALLEQLFSSSNDVKALSPQIVESLFREHGIRRHEGENGNPCWRLSDATPYYLLRNLELNIQLIGLMYKDYVCLDTGINHYHSLINTDKRRVLKLLDPAAYRRDLKKWWQQKKTQSSGKCFFEVDGEHFAIWTDSTR